MSLNQRTSGQEVKKASAIHFSFAHTLWKLAWNFPCYFTVLGKLLGPGTTVYPWELLKSVNKEQHEFLKWKALLWGRVACRQWNARTLAPFFLHIWMEVETGVARNVSVLLIYSGDACQTFKKQNVGFLDQGGDSMHDLGSILRLDIQSRQGVCLFLCWPDRKLLGAMGFFEKKNASIQSSAGNLSSLMTAFHKNKSGKWVYSRE